MSYNQSGQSKLIKSENGYTVIEVIIAIQLFVIVMTLLYSVFVFSQRFTIKWLNDSSLWQERLVKINFIEKELYGAKAIIELKHNQIDYLNDVYIKSSIHWSEDSVYVGNLVLNDLKINGYKTSNQNNSGNLKDIINIVLYFEKDSVFIYF